MNNEVKLTLEEFVSICALAYQGGRLQGEDTIGGLMKLGVFHLVGKNDQLVKLSHKIDDGRISYHAMVDEVIKEKKEKLRKKL